MNQTFKSLFCSVIEVTDATISYKAKGRTESIAISEIQELSVTEGTMGEKGYLIIKANEQEHKVEFLCNYNKQLREVQKKLGFKNAVEPQSVKDKKKVVEKAGKGLKAASSQANDIIPTTYKVVGINPATKRKKTAIVVDSEKATKQRIIQKSGLLEPCEIEIEPDIPPTEAQVKYARKLGIIFPEDATVHDASVFLTRAENDEPLYQAKAPTEMLKILIEELGIYIPRYAGKDELDGYFWYGMSKEEKYAYFAMRVYAENTGKNYRFIHEATNSEQEKFREFARQKICNAEFENSINCYTGDDIPINGKLKKKLKAYQIAMAYFMQ